MATARLIGRVNEAEARGEMWLFEASPPLRESWLDEEEFEEMYERKPNEYRYVVASAVMVPDALCMHGEAPKCYLFGADEEDNIVDWNELRGSRKGTLSPLECFGAIRYEVIDEGNVLGGQDADGD